MIRTALALSLAGLAASAQALAPGASTWGYAWGDFVIGCTTCPHLPITLSGEPSQSAGGEGVASAAVQYAGTPVRTAAFADYTLAGGVQFAASAAFSGALMTPLLGAMAAADNEQAFIIVAPEVPVGIDLYQAMAEARTQMRYRYLGAQAASYTFHFALDGMLSNDQSSLFGSATVYGGDVSDFETGAIDFGSVSLQGSGVSTPPFAVAGSFSVTVNLNPGESFWLVSQLGALASMTYSSADVWADAMHTLRVSHIDGDTGLLVAAAIPEPAPWLLLSLGLFSAAALRRRVLQ